MTHASQPKTPRQALPLTEREAELVITAPNQLGAKLAYEVGARMTLGVLTELLASSRTTLLIAAPFLQRGGPLSSEPLASALRAALERGVLVDIVSTSIGIRNLDSDLFRGTRAPVRFFQPAANITDTRLLGSHAKICVADEEHAYIGSANLTGPSIMSNLEVGLLVHGRLARQLAHLWRCLVDAEFFVEVERTTSF